MKKLVALFLAGVMAAALPASAFAATLTFKGAAKEEPEKKTLTLKGKDESKASSGKGLTLQGSSGVSTLGAANSAQATVQALGRENAAASGFTDVPAGAGYATAVDWAVSNGITNGTNAAQTEFSPGKVCDRGTIVTFLHRAYVPSARLTPN